LIVAPLALLAVMGIKMVPEGLRLWRSAEDKRDLILNRFIFNREARI